jgi:hypothetical protein
VALWRHLWHARGGDTLTPGGHRAGPTTRLVRCLWQGARPASAFAMVRLVPLGRRTPRRALAVTGGLVAFVGVTFLGALAPATAGAAATGASSGHLIPISQLAQRPTAAFPVVVPQLHVGPPPRGEHAGHPSSWGIGPSPDLFQSFEGISGAISPPDTNGAGGRTRQIEIINETMAIWDRGSPPTLLAEIPLATLTGSGDFTVDPRVIWDAQSERFYYAVGDDVEGHEALLTGFSTKASPSSPSDWCRYAIPQVNGIDQPRLGDSQDFILTGFFLFFGGPQVAWYAKPPPGPNCPATLQSGMQAVPAADTITAQPAHEIDPTPTGYVLSGGSVGGVGHLAVIRVTKDVSGNAVFSSPASIPVTAWETAPPAPQEGTSLLLDVGDPRLHQVVGAVDPSHDGRFALWTDQTVAGGAGAAIRWYEIDPATNTLFQSGTVANSSLWTFYGAISPDRLVNGPVARFGDSMVLTFDSSSPTSHPAIWVVSKRGREPQSTPALVRQSQVPYQPAGCPGELCRWGDYSGAAPDPTASPSARHGVVWGTGEWNGANPNPSGGPGWRTWIFTASP